MQVNVLGTERLIELCQKMSHLEAFVHVSTAYSNCYRMQVGEMFYTPPVSRNAVEKIVETLDSKTVDSLLEDILAGFPNTYTFTKCLAEEVVTNMARDLPTVIFRPAISMFFFIFIKEENKIMAYYVLNFMGKKIT